MSTNNFIFHVGADEVRTYQKLKVLGEIGRRGRKSRVMIFITVHDLLGMHDRYGKEVGQEICNLMAYKLFLRTSGIESAKWASDCMGTVEVLRTIKPSGEQPANDSQSVVDRPNVTPEQIRHGLTASPWERDAISGYADFPDTFGPFECKFRDQTYMPPPPQKTRKAPEFERLGPMTLEDLKRFKLDKVPAALKAIGEKTNA